MTENEKEYKKLVGKIGLTMIFFIVLINVLSVIAAVIVEIFAPFMSEMGATVIEGILNIIVYLASFMLPVGFFHLLYGKKHPRDMFLQVSLPGKMTFIYVFAGISVILAAAYINSYLISFFDFSRFSDEVLWESNLSSSYNIVLLFISTALVPAFCEEFLFRGMVLSNLLPYGKANAIIISAVLFGLMHQNAQQIFYATVAGIVLGYVYVVTKSIWVTTLMHFFNNFISVLQTVIYEKAQENIAWATTSAIDCLVLGFGIICIVIIFKHMKKTVAIPTESVYIKGFYAKDSTATEEKIEVSAQRAVKLFFAPTIIIFIIMCALTAVFILGLGMSYNSEAAKILGFLKNG